MPDEHSVTVERRPFVIPRDHEPFATGGLVKRTGGTCHIFTMAELVGEDDANEIADLMNSRRPPGYPAIIEAE